VLSLSQATECGTIYRVAEIGELTAIAHRHGVAVHMDGARLGNALARMNVSPAEATWKAMGTGLAQTHISVRLAEAFAKSGHADVGLRVVTSALEAVSSNAERYYAAELHRLQGELLWRRASSGAEWTAATPHIAACFQQALDIARQQGAKSLELRAVMSMCRLWQRQGRAAEARTMLEATAGWFKEGLDTLDLQEAKALAAALA
jgi:predicted ATPase